MATEEPDSAPAAPRPAAPSSGREESAPAPERMSWRVPGGVVIVKIVATLGFAVGALALARDTAGILIAAVAAVAIGLYALRDLLAPERLAVDAEGVTVVTGFARKKQIPWPDIERIRIDERKRLGMRSVLLEIDTGGTLHLIGPSEVGAPVEDVAAAVRRFRTGR